MTTNQRQSVLLSQNFLKSRRLVERLIQQSSLGAQDLVVEIGPGKGIITEQLAERCRQVIAVEKDPQLARHLRGKLVSHPNVRLHEDDFLDWQLPDRPYKVFASVPFNITTPVVTRLTTALRPPDDTYLILQREAAAKFAGERRESLYSVLLKPWFEPSIFHNFKRTDFTPPPRVDVVMLRLRKRGPPLVREMEAQSFRDFVVYAFTAPKPCLAVTLGGMFTQRQWDELVARLSLKAGATPTEVGFRQWLGLYKYFKMYGNPAARREVKGAEERLRRQQERLEKRHRTRVSGTWERERP